MAFFGVALVSVAAVPVFATWAVLSIAHGQPRIRRTLQVLSRCSGTGTAAGFVVALAARFRLTGGPPPDSSSIVAVLLQCLSIGAVVGFSCGLFIVVIDTAARFGNRYLGSVAAVVTLSVATRLISSVGDPRRVWTRFLDQITVGVAPADVDKLQRAFDRLQTADAKRAFMESLDWRAILAGYEGLEPLEFPSPWQFTVGMTVTITIAATFSLIHWRRSRPAASRCPAPDLSVPLDG
ncbi:hypothetical protein [Mycolicibacter kumamotonensis]|jgi:hypothetical protein|nr:hypothetical protein [Mycolicibacter kumamotonensis]